MTLAEKIELYIYRNEKLMDRFDYKMMGEEIAQLIEEDIDNETSIDVGNPTSAGGPERGDTGDSV